MKKSLLNYIIMVAAVYAAIWLIICMGIMTYTFRSLAVVLLVVSLVITWRIRVWQRRP